MKKLFLTSAILATIIYPTFADNITSTNKDCVNGTLTTYSGSAALEADWQPNPVTVTYYSGDSVYGNAGQCTYDSTLTLPSAPSKNGYTFAGWRVRASAAPSQQTLDCSIFADDIDECISHEECIYTEVAGGCTNIVETQYSYCEQAKTAEECENVIDDIGQHPCYWGRFNTCYIKSCSYAVGQGWCDREDYGYPCYWEPYDEDDDDSPGECSLWD